MIPRWNRRVFLEIWVKLCIIFVLILLTSIGFSARAAEISLNVTRGGTGGFDTALDVVGNDYCPSLDTAGCDFSASNNIVRTHDEIAYNFAIGVDATGDELTLQATLKAGMMWPAIPGVCDPYTSSISGDGTAQNPSVLSCELGTLAGQSLAVPFYAHVMGNVENNGLVGLSSVSLKGQNSAEIFANLSSVIDTTVTAKPRYNLRMKRFSGTPASIGDVQGYRTKYRFWIEAAKIDSNGDPSDDHDPRVGNEMVTGDVNFTIDLADVSPNAFVEECETFERYDVPFASLDSGQESQSVTDAGSASCASTGEGAQSSLVTVSGADLSLSHYPTKTSAGTAIEDSYKIGSYGLITVFIPLEDISSAEGSLTTLAKAQDFSPVSITGQENFEGIAQDDDGGEWSEDNEVTVIIENIKGAFSHTYRCYYPYATKPEWCSGDWYHSPPNSSAVGAGDGAILPSQPIPSYTYYGNLSFFEETDVELCSVIDTRYMELYDIEGQDPVTCWGSCTNLGVDYTLEYGVGYESTAWQDLDPLPSDAVTNECDSESGGWYNSLEEARAHGEVSRIRLKKPQPLASGKSVAVILSLRAKSAEELGDTPAGTLLKTWSTLRSSYTSPELRQCNYSAGSWPSTAQSTDSCGDRMHLAYGLARIEKTTEPNNVVNEISAGGTVKYKLQPSLTAIADGASENIQITDQLPAGGEYVEGTALFGGVPIDPTVTGDIATGQTLVWDIGEHAINSEISSLTFDMFAPLETPDQTKLNNQVMIASETDNSVAELRTDSREISVTAPATMLISKRANVAQIDSGDLIEYEIEYLNSTAGVFNWVDMIDILPYNGDGRTPATSFSGELSLASVSTESTDAVYYFTADDPASIHPDPTDVSNDLTIGSVNWCPTTAAYALDPTASPTNGGAGACPTNLSEVTAVRLLDNQVLSKDERRKFNISVQTATNRGGDSYSNFITGLSDRIAVGARSDTVNTTVIEEYGLGVAKRLAAQDGLNLTYQLRAENLGNTPFSSLALNDNLDDVFGAGNYRIVSQPTFVIKPVSDTISLNPNYTGSGNDTNLIAAGGILEPYEFVIISFEIEILRVTDRGDGAGVYANSATVAGVTPAGAVISNPSTDGEVPDPNTQTDTVASVEAIQTMNFTQTKTASNINNPARIGDSIEYDLTLENTGNMPFENASITLPHIPSEDLEGACDFLTGTALLDVGETVHCVYTYTLSYADLLAGELSHQAQFSSDDGNFKQLSDSGNPSDETGGIDPNYTDLTTALINVLQIDDVSALFDPPRIGDVVSWQVEVQNIGESALSAVSLLPNITDASGNVFSGYDVAFLSATGTSSENVLNTGDRWNGTVSIALTQEMIDQGSLLARTNVTANAPSGFEISDLSDDPNNSADIDANGDTNPDDGNVVSLARAPEMTATQTGVFEGDAENPRAGDEVLWTVDVINTGNVTVDGLVINPNGVDGLNQPLSISATPVLTNATEDNGAGRLVSGETETYQWRYAITQTDIDSGRVFMAVEARALDPAENTLRVRSDDPENSADQDSDGDGQPDDKNQIDFAESLAISALLTADEAALSQSPLPGEIVNWNIEITNDSNVTLNGVLLQIYLQNGAGATLTLADDARFVSASQNAPEGILKPNETALYIASYTLTNADIDSGSLTATANVAAMSPTQEAIRDESDDPNDPSNVDTNLDGNPDDPTVLSLSSHPAIEISHERLAQSGQEPVRAGDVLEWRVSVANIGNVTVNAPRFSYDIADGNGTALDLDGPLVFIESDQGAVEGVLGYEDVAHYRASITLTQDMIENGVLTSLFSVSAQSLQAETINATENGALSDNLIHVPMLSIINDDDKSALSSPPHAGQTLRWNVEVTNSGNVALSDLTLSNNLTRPNGEVIDDDVSVQYLSSSASSPEGTLLVGETAVYEFSKLITQVDIDQAAIYSQINARALDGQGLVAAGLSDDPDGDPQTAQEITVTSLGQFAAIDISAAVSAEQSGDFVQAGSVVTWTLNVRNRGNVSLKDLTLTTALENGDGTSVVADGPPRFTNSSKGSLEGNLLDGEIAYYELSYTLTQADIESGSVRLNGSATALSEQAAVAEDALDSASEISLVAQPAIFVSLQDDLSALSNYPMPGEVLKWELTIKNTGNIPLQSFRFITSFYNGIWSQRTIDPPVFVSSSDGSPEGYLKIGETATYRLEVALDNDLIEKPFAYLWARVYAQSIAGQSVNDLSDDPDDKNDVDYFGDNNPDDPTYTVFKHLSKMSLTSSADVSALSDIPQIGETITWNYALTNHGNVNLTDSTVYIGALNGFGETHVFNSGAVFLSSSKGSPEGTLQAGETAYFTVQSVLTERDLGSGRLREEALAFADNFSGVTVSARSDDPSDLTDEDGDGDGYPDDETVVILAQSPALSLNQGLLSGSDQAYFEGDLIEWFVDVTNSGNLGLSALDLSVALFDGAGNALSLDEPIMFDMASLQSVEGSLKLGETARYKAGLRVTQVMVETGFVSAQFSASASTAQGVDVSASADAPLMTNLEVAPALDVALIDDATAFSDPPVAGDVLSWFVAVTNTGGAALTGVELSHELTREGGDLVSDGLRIEHVSSSEGSAVGDLLVGETAIYEMRTSLAQADIDAGAVYNQARVAAHDGRGYNVVALSDDPDGSEGVDFAPTRTGFAQMAAMAVRLSALENETAPRAGDEVRWQAVLENTGNVSLAEIALRDDLANRFGDALDVTHLGAATLAELLPGEDHLFEMSYVVTQADVESGGLVYQLEADGVPPSGVTVSARSDEVSTEVMKPAELQLRNVLSEMREVLPLVYELTYRVDLQNMNENEFNELSLTNDLLAALGPDQIQSAPELVAISLPESIALNPQYDGVENKELLLEGAKLRADEGASFEISLMADFTASFPDANAGAQVIAQAAELDEAVLSDDPNVTPTNGDDRNPARIEEKDSDQDGVPDSMESSADMDHDGKPDMSDFDPMGYLYCEENGRIVTGAELKVTGDFGAQQGLGRSNNITIRHDGSDGVYQFFVSRTGDYQMEFSLPEGLRLSEKHLPGERLSLTSLLPANPAYYGASLNQAGDALMAWDHAANPYSMAFTVAEGSPFLMNNNIPVAGCAEPAILVSIENALKPIERDNENFQIMFDLVVKNSGETQLSHFEIQDNFKDVYGADYFLVESVDITNADGNVQSIEANLLGDSLAGAIPEDVILQRGEALRLHVTANVIMHEYGTFKNYLAVKAFSPIDPSLQSSDEADVDFVFEPSQVEGAARKITLSKETPIKTARIGDQIPYEIQAKDVSGQSGVVQLIDELPAGLVYKPGSARVDGVAVEPELDGQNLVWNGLQVGADKASVVTYRVRLTTGAQSGQLVNRAYVLDDEGEAISNRAQASIELQNEAIFECSDLIGKVFVDLNGNLRQDVGERGMPKIKLATIDGKIITTDEYGRYSLPCASDDIGSLGENFILKLDERSLPVGYDVASDNPESVRLTSGKAAKLNFALSIENAVTLNLSDRAFEEGSAAPKSALEPILDQIIVELLKEPAVLLLNYQASDDVELAQARLKEIERLITRKWSAYGQYALTIESRIVDER